jgi:hypothetical protein
LNPLDFLNNEREFAYLPAMVCRRVTTRLVEKGHQVTVVYFMMREKF